MKKAGSLIAARSAFEAFELAHSLERATDSTLYMQIAQTHFKPYVA